MSRSPDRRCSRALGTIVLEGDVAWGILENEGRDGVCVKVWACSRRPGGQGTIAVGDPRDLDLSWLLFDVRGRKL